MHRTLKMIEEKLCSRMVLFTEGTGLANKSTAMEFRYGLTVHATRETGFTIKLMAKASFGT